MNSPTAIDMLIHVDHPDAKARLATRLAECPGILKPRIASCTPNLQFIRHDPRRFDIRSVPGIAKGLGIDACIVEI
jgi:hypothetical protein